jgi:hypothetical protein
VETLSEAQVGELLLQTSDNRVKDMSKDTALVKSLTKVLNTTLAMAKDPPTTGPTLVLALGNKALALSSVAEKATGSKNLQIANFVTGQTMKTIGLTKLVGVTPAKAGAYMTLVVAEKVVAAAGLGQVDKCKLALASLAATTGMGAFACAGTVGIGCVAGAIAIAADAFDAYGKCQGPPVSEASFAR